MNNADEKLRDRWVLDTAERTLERIKYIEDALGSGKSGNDLKEYLLGKGINAMLADGAVKAVEHYKNLDKTMAELKNAVIHAIETVATESVTKVHDPGKNEVTEIKSSGGKPLKDVSTHGTAVNVQEVDAAQGLVNYGPGFMNQHKVKPEKNQVSPETGRTIAEEDNAKSELKEPETGHKEVIAGIIDKLDTGKGIQYSTVVEAARKAGIDPETVESGIKELMDEGRCYEPKIGVLRKV